jgi:hypothetical protein
MQKELLGIHLMLVCQLAARKKFISLSIGCLNISGSILFFKTFKSQAKDELLF